MQIQRSRIVLATAACALLATAWRLAPSSAAAPQTEQVRGAVHVLYGEGCGNIGLSVGADGVLMVDDQFEHLAQEIQASIDALAQAAAAPRFVVNTHFHGDHTGANAIFGRGGTILAHDNVRARLASPKEGSPMAAAGLPVITYADALSLHFNGERVRVVHYPGCHTDGDSVVFFEGSNVVHLGDLFFNGMFPFVDRASGGSVRGLERAILSLVETLPADAKLIPGHGPLATLDDLKRYHAMLVDCLALVGKAVKEGQGTREIVDGRLLANYDSWSWRFITTERFVETLVGELGVKERK